MLRAASNCMEFILTAGKEFFHSAGHAWPYLSVLLLLFLFQFAQMGSDRQSCRGAWGSFTRISRGALGKVVLTICGILTAVHCL